MYWSHAGGMRKTIGCNTHSPFTFSYHNRATHYHFLPPYFLSEAPVQETKAEAAQEVPGEILCALQHELDEFDAGILNCTAVGACMGFPCFRKES